MRDHMQAIAASRVACKLAKSYTIDEEGNKDKKKTQQENRRRLAWPRVGLP